VTYQGEREVVQNLKDQERGDGESRKSLHTSSASGTALLVQRPEYNIPKGWTLYICTCIPSTMSIVYSMDMRALDKTKHFNKRFGFIDLIISG
jgi:hypothetical protein